MTETITAMTSGQERQIVRLAEDAARKVLAEYQLDKNAAQFVIEAGDEFQQSVATGVRQFFTDNGDTDEDTTTDEPAEVLPANPSMVAVEEDTYRLTRAILGNDFISPQEVAKARGIVFTDEQLAEFADTLPTAEELQLLRKDDYILVPGPATPKALLDIRAMHTAYFYNTKRGGWYVNADQAFSRDDKARVRWYKVPKTIYLSSSLNKNWDEQVAMVSEDYYILNAAELAWVVTTYHAVRGIYLLLNRYARTSSVSAGGRRGCVGYFGSSGLGVGGFFDVARSGDLGLAVARK